MEVDIDVDLSPLTEKQVGRFTGLPSIYKMVKNDENSDGQEPTIRYSEDSPVVIRFDVGDEILSFLQGLKQYEKTIAEVGGVVRLGIYYDLDETIIFPLRLSAECVKLMSKFNLSLDSTGYPCDGEKRGHHLADPDQ